MTGAVRNRPDRSHVPRQVALALLEPAFGGGLLRTGTFALRDQWTAGTQEINVAIWQQNN